MAHVQYKVVTDAQGTRGIVDTAKVNANQGEVAVLLQNGTQVHVSAADLVLRDNGTYYLPTNLNDLAKLAAVIPVVEEQVKVDKHWVETGQVQVTKRTREEEQIIHETTLSEEVDIQRVPMNQPVDTLLAVRYEGETLVIPVVEEVLVVEKRLMLKEEVRITRRTIQTPIQQPVTVRKQEVIVQHHTHEAGVED